MRITDKEGQLSLPSKERNVEEKGSKDQSQEEEEESRVKQMFGHKGRRGIRRSIKLWETRGMRMRAAQCRMKTEE